MPSSAEPARDTVVRTVIALERSCLDAESAFVERRWTDVDAAFERQAALTAQLAALFAASPETAPEQDAKVAQRVRGILAYREDQLRRMRAYRDDVGTRLDSIGKVNRFSRAIGRLQPTAHVLDEQY
ncbi:MAG: hypothetical protein JO164_13540 [Candidatus Eremiobacteraeota bacterium]|nr:hypothetical protein [Candidatus Eremiobacteraeota bacterium]